MPYNTHAKQLPLSMGLLCNESTLLQGTELDVFLHILEEDKK